MVKKKVPMAARNQEEKNPKSSISTLATAAAAEDKISHLKTLNNLLIKETMERREQVSNLNSLLDDLSADSSFLSSFEREIGGLVLSSCLESALMAKTREMMVEFVRSKGEHEDALKAGMADDGLKILKFEHQVKILEKEMMERNETLEKKMEEIVRSKKEEMEDLECKVEEREARNKALEKKMDTLMNLRVAETTKISVLEEELGKLALAKDQLEEELIKSGDAFHLLKKEDEGLRSRLSELSVEKDEAERARGMQEAEIAELQIEIIKLQAKVMELEGVCKDQEEANTLMRAERDSAHRDLNLHEAEIASLMKEIQKLQSEVSEHEGLCKDQEGASTLMRAERDSAHRDLNLHEAEIAYLQKEIQNLQSKVSELEGVCKDHFEANTLIQAERDSAHRNINMQEAEIACLQLDVQELQSKVAELERMCEDHGEVNTLMQAERDSALRDINTQTGVLTLLQKEVQQLESMVSEIEGVCKDHAEANTLMQAERDSAHRDLKIEKDKVEGLRSQVAALESSKVRVEDQIERLRMEFGQVKKEKDEADKIFELQMRESSKKVDDLNRAMREIAGQKDDLELEIEVVKGHLTKSAEEKALLEKRLNATQKELQDTERKMEAATVNSERTLALLRSASNAILGGEEVQENLLAREIRDESLCSFAAELETMKTAFSCRELVIKDLSLEMARKKNGRLFTWLVPVATTAAAAVAAGLAAYAAKGI